MPKQKHSSENNKFQYMGIPIYADSDEPHKIITDQVKNKLKKGDTILDLGAGAGALSQRLIDLGYSVVAADMKQSEFLSNADYVVIDLNKNFASNFDGQKYDCIIATEVLEHLESPLHFLGELNKLLTDNGISIISIPNIYIYPAINSFLKNGSFINWNVNQYWDTGHQTILPDWLFEQHCKKSKLQVVDKIFCSKISLSNNLFKRLIIKLYLKIICLISKNITYEMRVSDHVIFNIVKE